jgi:hypothetical protein
MDSRQVTHRTTSVCLETHWREDYLRPPISPASGERIGVTSALERLHEENPFSSDKISVKDTGCEYGSVYYWARRPHFVGRRAEVSKKLAACRSAITVRLPRRRTDAGTARVMGPWSAAAKMRAFPTPDTSRRMRCARRMLPNPMVIPYEGTIRPPRQ